MAHRPSHTYTTFALIQGFYLVGCLLAAPNSSCAQVIPSTEPLVVTDVSGAAITPPKSGNIFDASPRVQKQDPPVGRSAKPDFAVPESDVTERRPELVPRQEADEREDIPTVSAVTRESIADRAGNDSALMQAVEQSRKLQQRLGIVSRPGGDPKSTLDNLKKNIDKQEQLKEKEQYRF